MSEITRGDISHLFRSLDAETEFDRELNAAVMAAMRRQRRRALCEESQRLPGSPQGYPTRSFRN